MIQPLDHILEPEKRNYIEIVAACSMHMQREAECVCVCVYVFYAYESSEMWLLRWKSRLLHCTSIIASHLSASALK